MGGRAGAGGSERNIDLSGILKPWTRYDTGSQAFNLTAYQDFIFRD
jgi:hypothetical protein